MTADGSLGLVPDLYLVPLSFDTFVPKPSTMKRTNVIVSGFIIGFMVAGCGRGFHSPSIDESGNEAAVDAEPDNATDEAPGTPTDGAPGRSPAGLDPAVATRTLALEQATNVRKLVNGVLEFVAELPPGSKVTVPVDFQISQPDVRNSNGSVERSSTGFVSSVKILSTPAGAGSLSTSQIAAFNKINLYVSASIVGATDGLNGSFKVMTGSPNGAGYNALFDSTGRPKFSFSAALAKRFGSKVNKVIDEASVDMTKSRKILAELAAASDRKHATPKSLILIDHVAARKFSLAYESAGTVANNGAWSIAVGATAVRHGFENVPCAEFMSEMIREAYQRAGYSVASDFSVARGNQLIWSKTASVVGLSNALHAAGWSAWEPSKFRPPTGAVMMHGSGISPGHTFMSGGDDGRIVVDNGSPQGRDLRSTSASILKMMYQNGVFFLPPGITPKPW
jgi:hypothetical protein